MSNYFHVFTVPDNNYQAEFTTAAASYIRRWKISPPAIYLHPDAPDINTAGIPIIRNAFTVDGISIIPIRHIYFQVPAKLAEKKEVIFD